MKTYRAHISSIGEAPANMIAVLCYLSLLLFWSFGIVPLLLIFFIEKKSGLVRFHAMQATLLWLVRTVCGGGLAFEGMAAVVTGDASYMTRPYGWSSDITVIVFRLAVGGVVLFFILSGIVNAYRWQQKRIPLLGMVAQIICKISAVPEYNGEEELPETCKMVYPESRAEKKARRQKEEDKAYLLSLARQRMEAARIERPADEAMDVPKTDEAEDAPPVKPNIDAKAIFATVALNTDMVLEGITALEKDLPASAKSRTRRRRARMLREEAHQRREEQRHTVRVKGERPEKTQEGEQTALWDDDEEARAAPPQYEEPAQPAPVMLVREDVVEIADEQNLKLSNRVDVAEIVAPAMLMDTVEEPGFGPRFFSRKSRPVFEPMRPNDPNRNLPPDMRDPPISRDMM